MMLYPITRPRTGLYVSPSRLCVARIKSGFRSRQLGEYREHPLPDRCLHLSSTQNNLTDTEQFLKILESLIPVKQRPKSIAIALPDICARTGVFEFSTLPQKREEQRALIAWRMEKDFRIVTSKARMSYHIFPPQAGTTSGKGQGNYHVLATIIQQSIIESFETVFLQAGLAPMSVNLASMSAFNLCQNVFERTCALLAEKARIQHDQRVLVYIAEWGYTVLIFRDESPAFIRVKPARLGPIQQLSLQSLDPGIAEQEMGTSPGTAGNGSPPETPRPASQQDHSRMLANELIGTLQHYFDSHPYSSSEPTMIPVFLCGSLSPELLLPAMADIINKEFPMAGDSEQVAIKAFPIISSNRSLPIQSIHGLSTWTSNTLSSLGAVLATS